MNLFTKARPGLIAKLLFSAICHDKVISAKSFKSSSVGMNKSRLNFRDMAQILNFDE